MTVIEWLGFFAMYSSTHVIIYTFSKFDKNSLWQAEQRSIKLLSGEYWVRLALHKFLPYIVMMHLSIQWLTKTTFSPSTSQRFPWNYNDHLWSSALVSAFLLAVLVLLAATPLDAAHPNVRPHRRWPDLPSFLGFIFVMAALGSTTRLDNLKNGEGFNSPGNNDTSNVTAWEAINATFSLISLENDKYNNATGKCNAILVANCTWLEDIYTSSTLARDNSKTTSWFQDPSTGETNGAFCSYGPTNGDDDDDDRNNNNNDDNTDDTSATFLLAAAHNVAWNTYTCDATFSSAEPVVWHDSKTTALYKFGMLEEKVPFYWALAAGFSVLAGVIHYWLRRSYPRWFPEEEIIIMVEAEASGGSRNEDLLPETILISSDDAPEASEDAPTGSEATGKKKRMVACPAYIPTLVAYVILFLAVLDPYSS